MADQRPNIKARLSQGKEPVKPPLLLEADYGDLKRVVLTILERFPLPLPGASVLIKPNMLGPYKPEKAVTTHPTLVSAVVDCLIEAGAKPIVGDNSGARGYGFNQRCAEVTGIMEASHGHFVNLAAEPVEVQTRSDFFKKIRVSRSVIEADLVISLPKLKTHAQVAMTGAIKNTYGYIVGAGKSRLHSVARALRDFNRLLVDVYAIRPPDLNIMDAIVTMEGDGPSNGRPRRLGRIIASSDAIAVDRLAASLIGLDEKKLQYLMEARRRWPEKGSIEGFGPADLTQAVDFKLPISFVHSVASYLFNWLVFSFLKKSRFSVREDLCTACAICREGCPVGAISIVDNHAVIDKDECIACYCCQELCPEGAIELTRAMKSVLGH